MRPALLALALLAATPAAAQTPEMRAMAECIRNAPIDDIIHKRGPCDHLKPREINGAKLFPLLHQQQAAGDIVRYKIVLANCPKVKPGPRVGEMWKHLLWSVRRSQPDEALLKAYIEQEFQKERSSAFSVLGWCEEALALYGEMGRGWRNAIVMRDGSPAIRKCIYDGSCSTANTIEVYLY